MGVFGFLKRRRERESAIPPADLQAASTPPPAEPAEPVGQMIDGGDRQPISLNLGSGQPDVAAVVGMVGEALRSGQFQISQSESQVIDVRESGLREQIVEAMRQAGVDPDGNAGAEINAADYGDLQGQILQALSDHGVDLGESDEPDPGGDGSG